MKRIPVAVGCFLGGVVLATAIPIPGWKRIDPAPFGGKQQQVIRDIAKNLDLLRQRANEHPVYLFSVDSYKSGQQVFDSNRPLPGRPAWAWVTIMNTTCQGSGGVERDTETHITVNCSQSGQAAFTVKMTASSANDARLVISGPVPASGFSQSLPDLKVRGFVFTYEP